MKKIIISATMGVHLSLLKKNNKANYRHGGWARYTITLPA